MLERRFGKDDRLVHGASIPHTAVLSKKSGPLCGLYAEE
jgi:hypothetical protein